MENCIDFFKDFLKNELKPFMKSKGFKTSGQHFYIEVDKMIKFISIEKSSWNMKDSFTFWFNASIFDKLTHEKLHDFRSITKIPHNTLFNIIRASVISIGNVTSDSYTIQKETNPSEFKALIFEHLNQILIPFIGSLKNNHDLLKLYKNLPSGYIGPGIFLDLAIGFHEIEFGNKKEGLKFISKWIKEEKARGYWDNLVKTMEEQYK